jgi:hypothetical protein
MIDMFERDDDISTWIYSLMEVEIDDEVAEEVVVAMMVVRK